MCGQKDQVWQISVVPSGNEPTTFCLVVQHISQLSHHIPQHGVELPTNLSTLIWKRGGLSSCWEVVCSSVSLSLICGLRCSSMFMYTVLVLIFFHKEERGIHCCLPQGISPFDCQECVNTCTWDECVTHAHEMNVLTRAHEMNVLTRAHEMNALHMHMRWMC
jgi:hypothetical protein